MTIVCSRPYAPDKPCLQIADEVWGIQLIVQHRLLPRFKADPAAISLGMDYSERNNASTPGQFLYRHLPTGRLWRCQN